METQNDGSHVDIVLIRYLISQYWHDFLSKCDNNVLGVS
jgi:hypothetical protein